MTVEVRVTALMQRLFSGARSVQAEGSTLSELLENLEQTYPGFKKQVLGDNGQLQRFVNIYLNDEDVRFIQQLNTPLKAGDVISILPALAGGAWGCRGGG